jgi:putative Mg2+ transporter-C (MgtC) family protein
VAISDILAWIPADLSDWRWQAMARMTAAAFIGGIIGLEREIRGHDAGLRTHLLVCLGSAIAMVVSVIVPDGMMRHPTGVNINSDPGRIAYGVMAGIGFLGAGSIMRAGAGIRGLTTAASIWCTAALGLMCGLGEYLLALFPTVIIILTLVLLDFVEEAIPQRTTRLVVLESPMTPHIIDEAVRRMKDLGAEVRGTEMDRQGDRVKVELRCAFKSRHAMGKALRALGEMENGFKLIGVRLA